ncbi:hypothetical protein JG687_00019120 [Phytophthora cactorum]|uniref:Uncharacterized protein n=1 Tax=Phytophthora cactorum TaxID=29920 RepID=A0A8T1TL31_9STRA|nr:hypothetical protein JG687_00019120 [Phytophthora cactorum]
MPFTLRGGDAFQEYGFKSFLTSQEIWLDDTMVLSNDDCLTAYGDGTVNAKSVFTHVDYSSCSTSACMLRFYWLAFQGVDSEIVWQVYKDCVPLTGPTSGDSSSTTTTATSRSSTTRNEAATSASSTTLDSTTASSTTKSSATTGEATITASPATTGTSTTGGNSWTSTGSTATTNDQGGRGWSGGFGGTGGRLRK